MGLGYRARFVRETAAALMAKTTIGTGDDALIAAAGAGAANDEGEGAAWASVAAREAEGRAWLYGLRNPSAYSRAAVQQHLLAFPGVGPKVADCAALFSLDQAGVVPVDVHVWRIAQRDLGDPSLASAKSVTPHVYSRVGELFRAKYPGGKAGWAHSLLFAAELPGFIDLLPAEVCATPHMLMLLLELLLGLVLCLVLVLGLVGSLGTALRFAECASQSLVRST